jgi:hypothetical protein
MSDFGKISSLESLPLPDGPHVRDFDAAQKAAKKAARAAKKAPGPEVLTQTQAIVAAPALAGSEIVKESHALDSNASSESQSLVPDAPVLADHVDQLEPTKSIERKVEVEPLTGAALGTPSVTMDDLHQMSEAELDILETLSNEGKQRVKLRLMRVWDEMSIRFERGESVTIDGTTISGTGGKGMGKYLRSIGVDPAKRRSWKFEIRQAEALRLAQENPPIRPRDTRKEIIIKSETEADLIATAGVQMAKLLVGEGMTPPQERVNSAEVMAKDILESIADGRYERIEPPPPLPISAPPPETVTYADWKNHHLPSPAHKVKYFEEASANFKDRYLYAFQGSAFKKILDTLKDNPEKVLSNAHDFAQLTLVLRSAAENLKLLAAAITTGLTPPAEPAPEPGRQGAAGPPQSSTGNPEQSRTKKTPNVWDCHAGKNYPADAVYVGCRVRNRKGGVIREGSIFGNGANPVVSHKGALHTESEFRAYAIEKLKDPLFRAEAEKLRGRDLLCWCVQEGKRRAEFCHARVWLELLNNSQGELTSAELAPERRQYFDWGFDQPTAQERPKEGAHSAPAHDVTKRFRMAERTMSDLKELVIMDGDKVYDCYPLDAKQEAEAMVDKLNSSFAEGKPEGAVAAC